jgi:hypothetical protein
MFDHDIKENLLHGAVVCGVGCCFHDHERGVKTHCSLTSSSVNGFVHSSASVAGSRRGGAAGGAMGTVFCLLSLVVMLSLENVLFCHVLCRVRCCPLHIGFVLVPT